MADKITMSSQATIDENGESKLVYYRDDDAIHTGQDSGGTIVNFGNNDVDSGINDFSSFLSKIVSGMSLKKFLADFREGCLYVLNTSNIEDSLTSDSIVNVLSARQGKILDTSLSLYASVSEESTASLTFASALYTALNGKTLVEDRSYPIMIHISTSDPNSTIGGRYTGIIAISSSEVRFFISDFASGEASKTFMGIYDKSTRTVIQLETLANQAYVDAINTRLNFSSIISVPASGWTEDTSGIGGYYQTVSANGVTSSMTLLIDIYHDTNVTAENFATQCEGFFDYAASGWAVAGNNSITLRCYEAPEANFTIIVTGK